MVDERTAPPQPAGLLVEFRLGTADLSTGALSQCRHCPAKQAEPRDSAFIAAFEADRHILRRHEGRRLRLGEHLHGLGAEQIALEVQAIACGYDVDRLGQQQIIAIIEAVQCRIAGRRDLLDGLEFGPPVFPGDAAEDSGEQSRPVVTLGEHLRFQRLGQQLVSGAVQTNWSSGRFDDLLLAVADEKAGPKLWMAANGAIFAPYDGGVDLVLPDVEQVLRMSERHKDWLSQHPLCL